MTLCPQDPSRSFVSVTEQGGTPNYMAPELLNGTLVNEKCDVYSLACLMYECVTRKAPWAELAVACPILGPPPAMHIQIILAVAIQGRRPVIPPNCPPALHVLISSCWCVQ